MESVTSINNYQQHLIKFYVISFFILHGLISPTKATGFESAARLFRPVTILGRPTLPISVVFKEGLCIRTHYCNSEKISKMMYRIIERM